jgi:UDP-GlcNAc:undecaprenyl-phosphate GlcNAc-1-phosphate transferase
MHPLWLLVTSSFAGALVLTPICRNLFRRWGVFDHPDASRKLHARPIPNMGGIPIILAYLGSFAVMKLFAEPILTVIDYSVALSLAPAVALIFVIGLIDDRFGLGAPEKLTAQLIAAGWAYAAGVHVTGIAGHQLSPWLSVPVTMLWLVACTNAFNLIDGVDGLATGVGLFATATTLIAALLQHNFALVIATAPLVGALIGFLRYNFNPATIFLGDSGSLFIGFLLGCFGVIWSEKSTTILGMTAPLMALSIPILDLVLCVIRRFLRRQPIFRGDRGHIHHRLLDRGLSPSGAVLLLYGLCGLGAVVSIFQSVAPNRYAGPVILVFCAIAWIGIQNLGYAEFDQVRRMILAGGFREALNSQLALRAFRQAVLETATTEECWKILQEVSWRLGFSGVRWRLGNRIYVNERDDFSGDVAFNLRVPLADDDYVNFTRASSLGPLPLNVNEFVETVRTVFASQRRAELVEVSSVQFAGSTLSSH